MEIKDRNDHEMQVIRELAGSQGDGPVLMLNLNRYSDEAAFPHGDLYLNYMKVLEALLPEVGARVLWRAPVSGQPIGDQELHEVLAVWYPSHQAFMDLSRAPGSEENFRLRSQAVETAVIHRIVGDVERFTP